MKVSDVKDENVKENLLALSEVLMEFFGLKVRLSYQENKNKYGTRNWVEQWINWMEYYIEIVDQEHGEEGDSWWYGRSLGEAFEAMMNELKPGANLKYGSRNIVLPSFRSLEELRMKLELQGK